MFSLTLSTEWSQQYKQYVNVLSLYHMQLSNTEVMCRRRDHTYIYMHKSLGVTLCTILYIYYFISLVNVLLDQVKMVNLSFISQSKVYKEKLLFATSS